jgi:hypothetical protein
MLAWLQATPVADVEPSRSLSKRQKPEEPTLTRAEIMAKKGVVPDLPYLSGGHYLIDYLMEAGPISAAGMGPVVLTWPELNAWVERTGVDLQPWESRMVRRLSADYLTQSRKSEKLDCPSPAFKPLTDEAREVLAKQLESALDSLIDTRPKP